MHLDLNDNQKMILETATQIAQKELAPTSAQRDIERTFPKVGLQKLAEAGFLGMVVPKPMGGSGADIFSFVLATEAIAKACPSTALVFITHSIVARALAIAGSDEQKRRFLPAMIAGDRFGAFAATEPNSGSNPFAIATKATSDSDEFIVNGNKIFITGAEEAEVYLVVLRLDKAKAPPSAISHRRQPQDSYYPRRDKLQAVKIPTPPRQAFRENH